MKLTDAIDRATHNANSGGHSKVISRISNQRREVRFTFPRPPPKHLGATLVVEFRVQEGMTWTVWKEFQGYSHEEVCAGDWRVHSACGMPCGAVSWGPRQSPGNGGCENGDVA